MMSVELGHAVKYNAFVPNGATAIIMPQGVRERESVSPWGIFFITSTRRII